MRGLCFRAVTAAGCSFFDPLLDCCTEVHVKVMPCENPLAVVDRHVTDRSAFVLAPRHGQVGQPYVVHREAGFRVNQTTTAVNAWGWNRTRGGEVFQVPFGDVVKPVPEIIMLTSIIMLDRHHSITSR